MEDENIVELLYVHDEQGLKMTKDKYHVLLEHLSYNIVRNHSDSEECVNDSYIKLWNTIPPCKPRYLKAFLCKIIRQISIDKYRFEHRKMRDLGRSVSLNDLDHEISCSFDLEAKLDEQFLIDIINDFISKLDIESQTLFINKYFLFKSTREIADMFDLNENYINVKIYRIKKKLLKHLESEGYHLEKI